MPLDTPANPNPTASPLFTHTPSKARPQTNPMGYGAPFVRIYHNKVEITDRIRKFQYTYIERADDYADIEIHSNNRFIADTPLFYDGAPWNLVWGYIGGLTTQRRVVVTDTRFDYQGEGVIIFVKAKSKSYLLRQSKSQKIWKKPNVGDLISRMGDKLALESSPQSFIGTTIAQMIGGSGRENNQPSQDLRAWTDPSRLDSNNPLNDPLLPFRQYQEQREEDRIFQERTLRIMKELHARGYSVNPLNYFINHKDEIVQGNRTDAEIIQYLLDMEPGGPYVLGGRDGKIIVKPRNFAQAPVIQYKYAEDPNELLSFGIETRIVSNSGKASVSKSGAWDKGGKNYRVAATDESAYVGKYLNEVINAPFLLIRRGTGRILGTYETPDQADFAELALPQEDADLVRNGQTVLIENPNRRSFAQAPDATNRTINVSPVEDDFLAKQRKAGRQNSRTQYIDDFQQFIQGEQGRDEEGNEDITSPSRRTTGDTRKTVEAKSNYIGQFLLSSPYTAQLGARYLANVYSKTSGAGNGATDGQNTIEYWRQLEQNIYSSENPEALLATLDPQAQEIIRRIHDSPNGYGNYDLPVDAANGSMTPIAENQRVNSVINATTATARCIGNPRVEEGQIVKIASISKRHAGRYYITKSVHTISFGEGYIMELTLTTNAEGNTGRRPKKKILPKSRVNKTKPKTKPRPKPIPRKTPEQLKNPPPGVSLDGFLDGYGANVDRFP